MVFRFLRAMPVDADLADLVEGAGRADPVAAEIAGRVDGGVVAEDVPVDRAVAADRRVVAEIAKLPCGVVIESNERPGACWAFLFPMRVRPNMLWFVPNCTVQP
jgi:hypothetical protein